MQGPTPTRPPEPHGVFGSLDRTRASAKPKLTERDKTVLRFLFQGMMNQEIAARLEISEGAVKASLRGLFEKLGVRTRAQVAKSTSLEGSARFNACRFDLDMI